MRIWAGRAVIGKQMVIGAGLLVWSLGWGSEVRAEGQLALHDRVAAAAFETMVDQRLSGSGWFSAERGWGFTAAHVVKKRGAKLRVRQGEKEWSATVHAVDVLHDVALLKIDGETPEGLELAAKFPEVGVEVYLYGAPVFRHGVWMTGRVARKKSTYEFLSREQGGIRCFHVAAQSPKGMSGGPWVDGAGEVVGLQSGVMVSGDALLGISFVTPCDGLRRLQESKASAVTCSFLAAAEEFSEQPVEWLAELPEGLAGVVMKVVDEEGPLGKAGVGNGDVVMEINGTVVTTREQYYRLVVDLDPDREATLLVRNGEGEARTLTLRPVVQERSFPGGKEK